jgi:autotransporter strand-loop-strand O-heptosyltransferase
MNFVAEKVLAEAENEPGAVAQVEGAQDNAQDTPPAEQAGPAPAVDPGKKPPFVPPAPIPTQVGPKDIRYDFNNGCRVQVPGSGEDWRVRLSDQDTGNVLFETVLKQGTISSTKHYYLRARIEVWSGAEQVLDHEYRACDQEVLIQLPIGTIGDSMGWFPYAVKFQRQHQCKLTVVMAPFLIPLFKTAYPEITLITPEEVVAERYYATYNIGLFFDDEACVFQPVDFRHVGLHRTAGYILGVDPKEEAPRIILEDDTRPMEEPYVCIAVQSTTQAKYWNNPNGWHQLVKFLTEAGYKVVCVDRSNVHGTGIVYNHIPHGVIDQTGERPLVERVRWMRHAEFFVGLSSGLSWLAWAAGPPVVMISGFTSAQNEFDTPYRVINYHVCNSCWNDPRLRFDHTDFLWCPRHKDTARQFECTRLITAEQVISVIKKIPGFGQVGPKPAE